VLLYFFIIILCYCILLLYCNIIILYYYTLLLLYCYIIILYYYIVYCYIIKCLFRTVEQNSQPEAQLCFSCLEFIAYKILLISLFQ